MSLIVQGSLNSWKMIAHPGLSNQERLRQEVTWTQSEAGKRVGAKEIIVYAVLGMERGHGI